MNILLTGGSGFIGRNLYEGMKDKYQIFAPSSKELDLIDYKSLEEYINKNSINVIIHTAIQNRGNVLDHTLRIFAGIMRNIDKLDKVIHFGSGAEYAKTRDLVQVRESEWGDYIPKDDYGLAKYIIHQAIKNEEKIINLRLFGVYGRYEDYRFKFISNSIVKSLLKLPINIKQDVVFDYLYISDLIPVVEYFVEHESQDTALNIAPSESIKLSDIARIINDISQNNGDIFIAHNKLNFQYTGSNERLKRNIPDIKFTSYKNGITRLYEYYSERISSIDKNEVARDEYFTKSKIRK